MKALRHTLLLFVLPAVLFARAPTAFLYDRAAILQGEGWLLWTGHWVHFSFSHLAWNLAVLLGAGTWLEHLRPGATRRYVFIAAPLISLGLVVGAPAMHTYGGLSGLATGLVTLLALIQFRTQPAERNGWLAVLLLTAGKIAAAAFSSTPIFSHFEGGSIQVSALAHLLGGLCALPVFLSISPPLRATPAPAVP